MTNKNLNFQVTHSEYSSATEVKNVSVELDMDHAKKFAKKVLAAFQLTGQPTEVVYTGYSFLGFFDEEGQDIEMKTDFLVEVRARSFTGEIVYFDFKAESKYDPEDWLYVGSFLDFLKEDLGAEVKPYQEGRVDHASIDLETLDNKPTSVITAIGAFGFNTRDEKEFEFHVRIDWKDALKRYPQFTAGQETIDWWAKQSEEAQQELKGAVKIEDALNSFYEWWMDCAHKGTSPWGNGAEFDIAILSHAYTVVGRTPPWKYFNVEHMRTLVKIGRRKGLEPKADIPFEGEKHISINDARHEGLVIRTLLSSVGGEL